MDKLLTTSEAAKICNVSAGSIIRWIRESKIPAYVTPGGHRRIMGKDLSLFLQRSQMPVPRDIADESFRFLIISDKPAMGKVIHGYLEKGYADSLIEEAQDYFMAGWKASKFRPDLMILDLYGGPSEISKACELMRAFFETKKTPLLVLLPGSSPELAKKIRSINHHTDCLCKPLEKNEFSIKLEALLKRPQSVKRMGA